MAAENRRITLLLPFSQVPATAAVSSADASGAAPAAPPGAP